MNTSFRIAMIATCPFPYPRGTPIRILRMAEALTKRGHTVYVITYHLKDEQFTTLPFEVCRIPYIKTYQHCAPGPTYQKLLMLDPLVAVKLLRVLRRHQIDLIHAHHYESLLVAAAVRNVTNHPVIYDAHTLLASELPFYSLGFSNKLKQRVGYHLDNQLPKLADYTISVTDKISDYLVHQAGVSRDRIVTITNGVELDHFTRASKSPRPSLPVPLLLFTGNLAAYQGIDLMLRAFRLILNRHPEVRLRIVTDSRFDDYQPLAQALKLQPHLEFARADFSRVPHHLHEADVVLNPRVYCDGVPMKLLNYMAAGKPIVSFAGSAKTITHNETGLVVEDENIIAFADAVCRLLANPTWAAQLGGNAQQQVQAKYTWERVAEKVEAIYTHVSSLREPKPVSGQRSALIRRVFRTLRLSQPL